MQDAFNAFNTIETLKKLAKAGNKIIMMTIHQPRTDILELFDNIILLSAGKTMWFGTTHGNFLNNPDAIDHFAGLGYNLPPKTNPSDFFLDTITVDARSPELLEKTRQRVDMFAKSFAGVQQHNDIPKAVVSESKDHCVRTQWPSTWAGEFFILLYRNMENNIRDVAILGASIGQAIFLSFVISLLYWQSGSDDAGIQNRLGVFFFLTINLTFGVIMPSITIFPDEKRLIKRERAAGSYRSSSAFLAKWFSNVPTMLVSNMLMVIIVYWTVGLNKSADNFLMFLLICFVHLLVANGLGLAIGAAVPNVTVGQIVTPLIIIIFMLFGGLLLNLDSVPDVVKWIQWLSLISYSYKALSQNEFGANDYFTQRGQVISGTEIVDSLNLDNPSLWNAIYVNIGFAVFYVILGSVIFSYTSRPLMRLK